MKYTVKITHTTAADTIDTTEKIYVVSAILHNLTL